MKYGVVISARIDSSRLPGKALLPLGGVPMIIFLLRRLLPSQKADGIIFATTSNTEDDKLADIVAEEGIPVFRGAASDVMRRYVDVAHELQLPPVKIHCSVLAEDAIKAAINDYKSKNSIAT